MFKVLEQVNDTYRIERNPVLHLYWNPSQFIGVAENNYDYLSDIHIPLRGDIAYQIEIPQTFHDFDFHDTMIIKDANVRKKIPLNPTDPTSQCQAYSQ